jgi:hypothetical protein
MHFVAALELTFDCSHREVTVSRDLLVGATGGDLQRGVKLAGSEASPGRDRADDRSDCSFARAEELCRSVLVGDRVAGPPYTPRHRGGFDTRLGRVEDGAQSLEGFGDFTESLAVSGRHRVGIGGPSDHELAVDLVGELLQADGHLAGLGQAGQVMERAGGTDEVADLLAEVGCLFQGHLLHQDG